VESARARQLFSAADHAYLASVRPDGGPHVVPFTFVVVDDIIYWVVDSKPKSSQRLQRLINIEREPRVSAVADGYSADWSRLWWARADGVAAPVPDVSAAKARELLARKYPQYRVEPPLGRIISITVDRWTGWAAS